jgi:hypothetical protein
MRRIAFTIIGIFGFAVAGWSQAYYEASGQTAVFTLTAGAKSGPAAIRGGSVLRTGKNSGISVTTTRGGILVTLPTLRSGTTDIALYDVAGRQIYRQHGYSGASLRIETQNFASGMYTARIQVDGLNYSRRLMANR